jgi:hypothetical protein
MLKASIKKPGVPGILAFLAVSMCCVCLDRDDYFA